MKDELEKWLEEIKEAMDYYLDRADRPDFAQIEQSSIGHYIELKKTKERIEEILYGKDREVY